MSTAITSSIKYIVFSRTMQHCKKITITTTALLMKCSLFQLYLLPRVSIHSFRFRNLFHRQSTMQSLTFLCAWSFSLDNSIIPRWARHEEKEAQRVPTADYSCRRRLIFFDQSKCIWGSHMGSALSWKTACFTGQDRNFIQPHMG